MQENNATGAGQNEQGRAAFIAGSTTAGGSNFGQGSSQLGGESYHQGNVANAGANYNNEQDRLGDSSTGTSNEGASSQQAGAAQSGSPDSQSGGKSARDSDAGHSNWEDRGQNKERETTPHEGDRRDTGLESSSNLGDKDTAATDRRQSGSWSSATTNDDNVNQ